MKTLLHILLLVTLLTTSVTSQDNRSATSRRDKAMRLPEPRRMFGGYRITPKFCTPTRPSKRSKTDEKPGPTICMFNHECTQRKGEVVGACMDGFLFGACCQLSGETTLLRDRVEDGVVVSHGPGRISPIPNSLHDSNTYVVRTTEKITGFYSKNPTHVEVTNYGQHYPSTLAMSMEHLHQSNDVTLSGLAQITNTILQPSPDAANVVSPNSPSDSELFAHSTISHESADTILIDKHGSPEDGVARPSDFSSVPSVQVSTMQTKPAMTYKSTKPSSTTPKYAHKSSPSNQKPIFKLKPTKTPTTEKFVLVQTVTKPYEAPTKNTPVDSQTTMNGKPEIASIESILNMLNDSHPSTITYDGQTPSSAEPELKISSSSSYDLSSSSTTSPLQYSSGYPQTYSTQSLKKPPTTAGHYITTNKNKYQTTLRPSSKPGTVTPTKKPSTYSNKPTNKPQGSSSSGYFTRRPSTQETTTKYTASDVGSSTLSYDDYWGPNSETPTSTQASKKPPSTSYVYSPTPTKRPISSIHNVIGPSYDVSGGNLDSFSSVTPTVIVLSSLDPQNFNTQTQSPVKISSSSSPPKPPKDDSQSNYVPVPLQPHKKPIHQVTINNIISSTNLIHLNSKPSTERPDPTILITPKPTTVTSASIYSLPAAGKPSSNSVTVENKIQSSTYVPTTSKVPSTSYVYSSTISKRPTTTTPTPIYTSVYSSYRPSETVTVFPSYGSTTTIKNEIQTSPDDLINFPPVRNPNLNATGSNVNVYNSSISLQDTDDTVLQEVEFTTPAFLQEDEELDDKMSLFVNKIVGSLQGTFQELHDIVVLDKAPNATILNQNQRVTTKKPSVTTRKPTGTKPVRTPTTPPTTKRPVTTKKPVRATTRPTTPPSTVILNTKKPTKAPATTKRPKPPKTRPTTVPTTTVTEVVSEDEVTTEIDFEDSKNLCGVRPMVKSGRIVGGKGATFGEWPWQVLVRESTWLGLFTKNKCGGVLITNKYVTTAAHCQPGFLASLVAVFGEFDISGELESKRSVTKNVRRVIVHRQYDAATFENDLALLELESPVHYDAHIVPICMPPDEADFMGRVATVTGWGRLKYGGGVPSVLQEVQVPIIENSVCQEMFQTAGHSKVILNSFLCAGYANGQKDSCEGDSGGPLVLQRQDGRWELAGTVSHGIKCAAPYLPGVYMRTTFYKPWLKSITGVH